MHTHAIHARPPPTQPRHRPAMLMKRIGQSRRPPRFSAWGTGSPCTQQSTHQRRTHTGQNTAPASQPASQPAALDTSVNSFMSRSILRRAAPRPATHITINTRRQLLPHRTRPAVRAASSSPPRGTCRCCRPRPPARQHTRRPTHSRAQSLLPLPLSVHCTWRRRGPACRRPARPGRPPATWKMSPAPGRINGISNGGGGGDDEGELATLATAARMMLYASTVTSLWRWNTKFTNLTNACARERRVCARLIRHGDALWGR